LSALGVQIEHGAAPAAPTAPQRFPILIGVSGKRNFDKNDPGADRAVAQALAARFAALFAALDQDLPQTPKVLLTGAAFGCDLIAAEAALARGPQWAVTAILPFERALFEEDFRSQSSDPEWRARHGEHRAALERVLGPPDEPNPRVLVRELPKLVYETATGTATRTPTAAELARDAAGHDTRLRRNHYEQVGQFIAEIATIMIVVMATDEQPDISEANGGTARVAACRRAGLPDVAGVAVASASAVLRHEWFAVTLPPAGYVWLMDPHKDERTGPYPVAVLPPLTDRRIEDVYAGYPGRDLPHEHQDYVGPLRALKGWLSHTHQHLTGRKVDGGAALRRLRASLVVARGVERLHREGSPASGDAAVMADASPLEDVSGALNVARSQLNARQQKVNSYVRRDFHLLALLFVLAVFLFETYAKLFHEREWLLGLYLVVLAGIGFQALHGRWMLWEAVAEDYRAVAEALRVQRAWWAAGLDARVDREHLQGVGQDLSPIRDSTKTIIAWILLRHGFAGGTRRHDWALVRGTAPAPRDLRGAKERPHDWIGSQIAYFIKNGEDREQRVHAADAASWCLFVASGVLAAVLWAWSVFPRVLIPFERIAHIRVLPSASLGFDPSFFVWLALAILTVRFRAWNHDIRRAFPQSFLTGVLGTLAAIVFALAFISAGPLTAAVTGLGEGNLAVKYSVLAGLVVISAVAGARRYLMERLNVEAEALDYRDACDRFERAERLLAPGADPVTGAPADEAAARRVVHELGRLALAENEAWLKSRRERPLTPVVG
jgi:hypothetical protein